MGVFKNGVGRPSNETIKKRKIIYVLSALAVVAAIASTAYMLNSSFSSKKISGNVINTGKGITYEVLENKNVIAYSKVYYYIKPSEDGVDIKISNNNNYNMYYKFEYDETGSVFKSGYIKAKSNNTINIKNPKESYVRFSVYKTENDLKNNTNIVCFETLVFDITKSFVVLDGDIGDTDDPLFYMKPPVTRKETTFGNFNYNKIRNYSDRDYYYRIFLYKDTKVNGTKLASRGKCKIIKANSNWNEISSGKSIVLNEKNKKGTVQIKVYKNKSACNSDTLGISKYNTVETLLKDSLVFSKKDEFYVQLDNSKKDSNKLLLYVVSPDNFKKYQLEVYGKKKGSTKYSEVLNETYDYNMIFGKGWRVLPDITLEKKNMSSYRVYIRLLDENGNSDESISINNWKPEGYKIVNKDGNKWATRTYNIK